VALTATTHASVAKVAFQRSPAGADTWTTIGEDSSSPWAVSFDTTGVADGVYDLRAISYNSAGSQLRTAVHADIRIDNTRPRVVSSTPSDGSVVDSASSIVLTASESLDSVAHTTLDGLTVSPTVSGTSVTVTSGSLAAGAHVLEGLLVDDAGKRAHFRVAFTIPVSGSDEDYVEKNTSPDASTSLTSVGGDATVTIPSGAYTSQPAGSDGNDWLVLRLDSIQPPTSPGLGLTAGGPAVDVTATWAFAGTLLSSFAKPLHIVLTNTTGGNVVPATYEDGAWRVLTQLATAGTLPADWRDGYYVGNHGIHVLTRHLTHFALLIDNQAPSVPTAFAGTIASGALTLTWTPGKDAGNANATTILYVNGAEFARYDGTIASASMGPFTGDDTRTFALAAADASGNVSAKTPALLGVPAVYGKTLDDATTLLAARGLATGNITSVASDLPAGTIVAPTTTQLVQVGSAVDLSVSPGAAGTTTGGSGTTTPATNPPATPQSPSAARGLTLTVVGTRSFSLAKRHYIGARINVSRASQVTATLLDPAGRTVYTWRLRVDTGATIVRLVIPAGKVKKAGRYTVVWRATAGGETVRRRIAVQIAVGAAVKAAQTGACKTVGVLVTGAGFRPQVAGKLRSTTRLTTTTTQSLFSMIASPTRNVQVVVIDLDRFGVRPIVDLRLVFPNIRILALSRSPKLQLKAQQAGATVAMSPVSPELGKTIETLAHPRANCT
jgi:hypothetical protein